MKDDGEGNLIQCTDYIFCEQEWLCQNLSIKGW